MKRFRTAVLVFTVALATGGTVLAQVPPADNIPNWSVPAAWSPSAHSGGIQTMTDVTSPRLFVGVAPCRLVDTRAGSGFPLGFGAPSLSQGVPRNFDLDNGPCPGLPGGIDAYSLNVTVVNTAGPGHLVIYPQGGLQPDVSSINYVAGQTIANAVIVPAGTNGGVTVVAGSSGTDLLIDINGYFSDTLGTPGNSFELYNNSGSAPTAIVSNTSTFCAGACGLFLSVNSGNAINARTVETNADTNYGIFGEVSSSGSSSTGVIGYAQNATGATYGVQGWTNSPNFNAAGVLGFDGTGAITTLNLPSGVRGESRGGHGVLGLTESWHGVRGVVINPTNGLPVVAGILGLKGSIDYGVFAFGDYGGSGAKYFVEPHPEKADMVIRYVSLEGNESGTYFRGRGKFQNGLATIEVPEDFRLVTDRENLSIQVTPIGEMASVAVRSIGLDRIVVRGSRNVEFFYTVNGVRKTHKHLTPIGPGREYMPETPDAKMPLYLTEGQKEMLISNGTYKPDGTVNMETARRLGWDKEWEKRSRPAPQPTE